MQLPPSCRIPPGLKRGDKGPTVVLLQHYLTLRGATVADDGDFGPATEHALYRLTNVRAVDASVADYLMAPLVGALDARGSMVDIARAYLRAGAREVGQNRGPWVRAIAGDAAEGDAWCMSFLRRVAEQAGHPWAHRISPSCDVTGRNARADGRLVTRAEAGDLFLVRGPSQVDPWTHGGLVTWAGADVVESIEGNSNDDGSREGVAVVSRVRGVGRLDFVRMGA
jgi:hypothetical protein